MRMILPFSILLSLLFMSAALVLAHGDKDHDDDDAADVSAVAVPEGLSYHEHIRPIIESNCVACHSEGQIAAYAPFSEAHIVQENADDIAWHVRNRYMPPWMPSRKGLPLMHDRSLSDEDIALIAAWVEAGAPLGDSAEYAPAATDVFAFEEIRADLVLGLDEEYMPADDLLDDYRCFAFPLELDEARFVTGFEFRPDVAEMAHHAIFYLVDEDSAGAIARRDREDGRPGWSCYGGTGLRTPSDSLGGWAPGGSPMRFPAGTGFRIGPGQQIILQLHYNLYSARVADRSQVILELAPAGSELEELIYISLLAPVEIPCPSGIDGAQCERTSALKRVADLYGSGHRYFPDWILRQCGQILADYAENSGEHALGSCDFESPAALTLIAVSGHMHELGRGFRMELNPESENPLILLDIPRWDFHWQDEYIFTEPVSVERGDVLRMGCVWDNTQADEPRYVVWGEGTRDEMCFGTVLALAG